MPGIVMQAIVGLLALSAVTSRHIEHMSPADFQFSKQIDQPSQIALAAYSPVFNATNFQCSLGDKKKTLQKRKLQKEQRCQSKQISCIKMDDKQYTMDMDYFSGLKNLNILTLDHVSLNIISALEISIYELTRATGKAHRCNYQFTQCMSKKKKRK